MMKKVLMLALSSLMVLGLAACGNTNGADASSSASKKADAAAQAPAKGNGKTLVVYYSAGGHTKNVANYIAKATNGDVMELKPAQDYTEADLDYNNRDSRVYREHDDASLRDIPLVKDKADNWEGYDTVFIGYPIWWGIAAWPVDTFVKHNDFSGKTVIPFATSASPASATAADSCSRWLVRATGWKVNASRPMCRKVRSSSGSRASIYRFQRILFLL